MSWILLAVAGVVIAGLAAYSMYLAVQWGWLSPKKGANLAAVSSLAVKSQQPVFQGTAGADNPQNVTPPSAMADAAGSYAPDCAYASTSPPGVDAYADAMAQQQQQQQQAAPPYAHAVSAVPPAALAMTGHEGYNASIAPALSHATLQAQTLRAQGVNSQSDAMAGVRQTDVAAMVLHDLREQGFTGSGGAGTGVAVDEAHNLPLFADAPGDMHLDAPTMFTNVTGDEVLDVHGTGRDSSGQDMLSNLPASVQADLDRKSRLRVQAYLRESDEDRAVRDAAQEAVLEALEVADLSGADPNALALILADSGRGGSKTLGLAELRKRRRGLRSRQAVLTDGRTLDNSDASKLLFGRCRGTRTMSSVPTQMLTDKQEDLLIAQACGRP